MSLSRREWLLWSAASSLAFASRNGSAANDPPDFTRAFPDGKKPNDFRLGEPVTLNGYFPFTPPATVEAWQQRKRKLREQLQVALGLWPMPEKGPIKATVHGDIERDGYVIKKVYFASLPGHYVTGNLYIPKGKAAERYPAVLCPHGHWENGRFYQAPANKVAQELKSGAESREAGAKFPLQARMATLAKMGFVVFHYDMIGYADSQAIPHRGPMQDHLSELRSINIMGLQTWNTIRSFDFLESLPYVDAKRIGVTGASGGGTQTFILCALDDRPAAAFPAVMVSTAMQGGCTCENCSYLRIGTGNVEFAAMYAPKPQAMSCANDWTKEFLEKGYPDLKKLYEMLWAEKNLAAKAWTQFPHNYNQVAREFMYSWFGEQLLNKPGPVEEPEFEPVPPAELSVYTAEHPRPKDELNASKLQAGIWSAWQEQFAKLTPDDEAKLREFRVGVGTALRAMIGIDLDDTPIVPGVMRTAKLEDGLEVATGSLAREHSREVAEVVPVLGARSQKFNGRIVVWVHPNGKASLFDNGKLATPAKQLVDAGYGVMAMDLLGIGELRSEKPFQVDKGYAGYTFGYNRPLLANRVRDLLAVIVALKDRGTYDSIDLLGWGELGPVTLLAKALAGDVVRKTAADMNQFDFEKIASTADPMMLPGALKFGGMGSFLALCAPGAVLVHNADVTRLGQWPAAAYRTTNAEKRLKMEAEPIEAKQLVEWLLA